MAVTLPLPEEIFEKNLYQALGVPQDSTEADIKKKFRKDSMTKHPDKGGDKAEFQALSEAYEVLVDAEARQEYDKNSPYGANYSSVSATARESSSTARERSATAGDSKEFDFGGGFEDDFQPTAGNPFAFFDLYETIQFIIRMRQEILWQAILAELEAQNRQPEPPKNTGYGTSDNTNLVQIERQLSDWFRSTGRDDDGFSCKIVRNASGDEELLVTAPKQRAQEVIQFLESKGLAFSMQKGAAYDHAAEEQEQETPSYGRRR